MFLINKQDIYLQTGHSW